MFASEEDECSYKEASHIVELVCCVWAREKRLNFPKRGVSVEERCKLVLPRRPFLAFLCTEAEEAGCEALAEQLKLSLDDLGMPVVTSKSLLAALAITGIPPEALHAHKDRLLLVAMKEAAGTVVCLSDAFLDSKSCRDLNAVIQAYAQEGDSPDTTSGGSAPSVQCNTPKGVAPRPRLAGTARRDSQRFATTAAIGPRLILPVLLRKAALTRLDEANRALELRAWVPVHPDESSRVIGGYACPQPPSHSRPHMPRLIRTSTASLAQLTCVSSASPSDPCLGSPHARRILRAAGTRSSPPRCASSCTARTSALAISPSSSSQQLQPRMRARQSSRRGSSPTAS